jgi:hypothetical protein
MDCWEAVYEYFLGVPNFADKRDNFTLNDTCAARSAGE